MCTKSFVSAPDPRNPAVVISIGCSGPAPTSRPDRWPRCRTIRPPTGLPEKRCGTAPCSGRRGGLMLISFTETMKRNASATVVKARRATGSSRDFSRKNRVSAQPGSLYRPRLTHYSADWFCLANSALVDQSVLARSGSPAMTTSHQYDDWNRLTSVSSVASGNSVVIFQYSAQLGQPDMLNVDSAEKPPVLKKF